ncbi:CesT family type III secretion system chaperone [Vibrio sp. S4M6]|uniref:CesT family type III secretion system chaperone n=1 Tax=Vibrio sinus TaxID=2946865 RepID=UPI002029DFC6|nr:CesT family type III secretion system chaperone [Vibrio sinus]MCL9783715.1 CesT family type III secretion system chaperone [Vibrio sinus]
MSHFRLKKGIGGSRVKTSQSKTPSLNQFRAIASENDVRVISKRGKIKEPSVFHRGHKYSVISEHVLKEKYDKYFQENIKTHLDLKQALLKEENYDTAMLAYSLVGHSGYRGEPLTERKIHEVVTLLGEIKVGADKYQELKHLFDAISQDPRLHVSLETQYPGKMDGLGTELLEMAKDNLAEPILNTAINLVLPGVGLMVATGRELYKASVNGDAEAYHHQLEQISQLPGRDRRLSLPMQQTLATDHAQLSEEAGVGATLGMATGGLGTFGVAPSAVAGVMQLAKKQIGTVAASLAITGGGFVARQVGDYYLDNEGNQSLAQEVSSGVLPRLEISNAKGKFTFSMQDAATVRALMAYLGPKEDTNLTKSDAPDQVKKMEKARLAVKKSLGSQPSEHLVPNTHALSSKEGTPSTTETIAVGALRKLLNEDWNWLMPAVRCLDEGHADQINAKLTYKLPLEAPNGRVFLDKSPNLTDEQLDSLSKMGSPSQLRLMYLAEGWM